MPTLLEATTWDLEEIQAHIEAHLPENSTFSYVFKEGSFEGVITRDGVVVWEDLQADERLLLFNAFGWVYIQQSVAEFRNPAWVRGEITIPIARQAIPELVKDPEDLDPEEISAVLAKALERT